MTSNKTSAAFFEEMYRQNADPWDFATNGYERGRYEVILRTLGERRYERAFEPGCSVGVLTEGLAAGCGQVLAMDISPSAVEQARLRCRKLENVRIECGSLADVVPEGTFDLIVLSEIGYYFEEARLKEIAESLSGRLPAGGTLLGAHWLGSSADHVLSGDQVHAVLGGLAGLKLEKSERLEGFRLDVWCKA